MASLGHPQHDASGAAASSSGRPVTSQWAAALASAIAAGGRPESRSWSSEPSSRSAPNSRSSGSSAASSAQTQTMPGAMRPSVSGAGPIASGNSAAVSTKNSRAASVSAPWRSDSRSSRARTAAKAVMDGEPAHSPLAGGRWGRGRGQSPSSPAPVPRPRPPAAAGASPRPPCRRRAVRVQHGAEPLHRRRVQPERRFVQQPERSRDSASRASASRRRCPPTASAPAVRQLPSPTASSASSHSPPVSRAANRRFSAAVSPGFTASWWPT